VIARQFAQPLGGAGGCRIRRVRAGDEASNAAASATVLVIGPAVSWLAAIGRMPVR